jgi:hypothetical protein
MRAVNNKKIQLIKKTGLSLVLLMTIEKVQADTAKKSPLLDRRALADLRFMNSVTHGEELWDQGHKTEFTVIPAIVQIGVKVGTTIAKALIKATIKAMIKGGIKGTLKSAGKKFGKHVLSKVADKLMDSKASLSSARGEADKAFKESRKLAGMLPSGQSVANLEALEKAKQKNEMTAKDLVPVATYANLKSVVAADAAFKASQKKAANPIQETVNLVKEAAADMEVEVVLMDVQGQDQLASDNAAPVVANKPHDLASVPEGFTKEQWIAKCDKAESLVSKLQSAEEASETFKAAVAELDAYLDNESLDPDDPAVQAKYQELTDKIMSTGDTWVAVINSASTQGTNYVNDAAFLGNDPEKTNEGLTEDARSEAALEREVTGVEPIISDDVPAPATPAATDVSPPTVGTSDSMSGT